MARLDRQQGFGIVEVAVVTLVLVIAGLLTVMYAQQNNNAYIIMIGKNRQRKQASLYHGSHLSEYQDFISAVAINKSACIRRQN